MRGLARQRLPARHARQVDEPLAVLLELIGHVVERLDRPAPLRRGRATPGARPGVQPSRPVAAGEIGERRGELPDRPADAMSDEHQRQQRDEPRRAEQHEQRQRESAPQVARIDRRHEPPRFPDLRGQLLHADAAEVAAIDLDAGAGAGGADAPHVVHALAVGAGDAEAFGFAALPERSNGLGPVRAGRRRRRWPGVSAPRARPAFSASRSRW